MSAYCRMTASSTLLSLLDTACKDTLVNSLRGEQLVTLIWPKKLPNC